MASASSDDDGRSFGSEPDFAAMSSLRLVEDDPGPSGTHVFDEIHDDAPRDFGHELEVADGERLRAALEAFEDAVYDDGAGGASSANDPGSGPVAAAGGARADPASARAKPRRVHADRQTTRPVLEQAREWRGLAPHLRVRGARVASAPRRETSSSGDASAGVQMVAMPPAPASAQREAPGSSADDDAAPWRLDSAGEWWGESAALRVRGREARLAVGAPAGAREMCDGPLAAGAEEEVFAEDGELVETFADDTAWARGALLGFGRAGTHLTRTTYWSESDERAARRRAAGLPCVDPRVVLALDRAFLRGELRAGEAEGPVATHRGGAGHRSAWRAEDEALESLGGSLGDLESAFGDDDDEGDGDAEGDEGGEPSALFPEALTGRVLAYSDAVGGFDDDAQRRSPPDPWPGEVRWGAPGARSESEWSDADSEELRRWAPEPPR